MHLHPLDKGGDVFKALEACLNTKQAGWLGRGRDVPPGHPPYSGFKLLGAWRNENLHLWERYISAKQKIEMEIMRAEKNGVDVHQGVSVWLDQHSAALPGKLNDKINEKYLLHGTKCSTALTILTNGANKNYSGGLFGAGSYFAEDAGKNDQYVYERHGSNDKEYDKGNTELAELHKRLYRKSVDTTTYSNACVLELLPGACLFNWLRRLSTQYPHPKAAGQSTFPNDSFGSEWDCVYYLFLCRVAIGQPVFTKDGSTNKDSGEAFWAPGADEKELRTVPGVAPPFHFHSLIAEAGPGCRVDRYREFIVFHDEPGACTPVPIP